MFVYQSKTQKWLGGAILLAFVIVGVFGIFHFAMNMGGNTAMTNCPFMEGGSAVCPMGALEHIAIWQKTVTAIPSLEIATLLLLALLAVTWQYTTACVTHYCVQRERFRDALAPPRLFERLYSDGLLNPKTF